MNKIFKVIWNEARNAYVVVSEIAKNHGSKSCSTKKLLAMLIATGVMTCASVAPAMAKNLTDTQTPPKMIGYKQKWNTDVAKGLLETSINGYQYQGNSLQLNMLQFKKFTTQKGENALHITLGAYVDGVNKNASINFVDTNTKNQTLTTTIKGSVINTVLTDTDNNKVESSVDIGSYVGQEVKKAKTEVKAGENVTSVVKETGANGQDIYTINAKDTTYVAGNGIVINGENNAISVKLKEGESNLQVTDAGLELKKDLTVNSVNAGDYFFDAERGVGFGGEAYVTQSGLNANNKVITNVAAGTEDTDAVNVAQLKKVSEEAGKHSVVTEGANITVTPEQAEDGRMQYNVALNNDILLSGDNDAFVNISGSKGSVWASGSVAAGNVIMDGTTATVSGLGNTTTAYDGFANGEGKAATEEQLKEISKVADNANQGWNLSTNGDAASKVAPGETVDFSGDKNISVKHDGTKVQVELNKNIDVHYVQTNALNSKYNLSVGTMAENGIMPFFVNSNGAFYAANNNFSVDKDGKVTATAGEIGNVVLNNGVFYKNSALRDGELFIGDNDGNYSQITTKGAKLGQVVIAADGKISNVAAGVADTDAVNVGQLKEAVQAGNTDTHITPGEYDVGPDNKVNMDVVDKNGNKVDTVTIKDVAKASDVGNVSKIADDLKNGGNKPTTVVDAVNNLNNKLDTKVGDLQYSKVEKGDIADGDSTTTAIGKLDQKLTDVEATAAKHTKVEGSKNIIVENTAKEGEAANYKVELSKEIYVDTVNANTVTANTVTTGQTVMNNDGVKVGKDVSVTATAVTAGKTSISDEGVKVGDKTYISADGLNANGQHITNVKAGEADTDAVNYGQLKNTNNRIDGVENQVISNSNRINQLGNRVNKVGAGAAALAALHPMDFDPDDKLTFSAGYGNYGGENAAAIGAYYRPDEKVMFSVAGTVGNGENMVNAGVSFALDRTNHVSNSRTALAREVIDLRGQLAVMGAKMAKMEKAFGMLDETKTKLFPDVPANHWAYEYIAKLAGNGYIEGYPDGNFGGDRLMTRYEFAAMLYRAIENGAALEEKIIKEFEPELGRIRVDRISGEDGDRDKIERVRVNDTKGERDHYGNKLAK